MSSGVVVSWGTKGFVLAEDAGEAQALFKKQNVAIDTVEEVDRAVKSKPARIISKKWDASRRYQKERGRWRVVRYYRRFDL